MQAANSIFLQNSHKRPLPEASDVGDGTEKTLFLIEKRLFLFILRTGCYIGKISRKKGKTMVQTETLTISTRGHCQILDITGDVQAAIERSGLTDGTVTVFHIGSTAGMTTLEYEPGLVNHDINAAFETFAPTQGPYAHEETWHDDNGHAHVRAALLGPSLTVPFCEQRLTLGTWQQIVLIDFDTRDRDRTVICQMMGP